MVRREILAVLKVFEKGAKSPKPKMSCPPKLVSMHFTSISTCMNFLSQFYFLTPMDYSPWSEREIWSFLKVTQKGAKSPKPEMSCPPKLVSMHFTSTSTCINFLSQFYFLTPMDYSPWSEGKFGPFRRCLKKEQNLRNQRCHAHQNWFPCISHQPPLA